MDDTIGTRMTRIWADLHGFFLCYLGFEHEFKKNPCKSAQIRVIRVPIVSSFPKWKLKLFQSKNVVTKADFEKYLKQ
jgi:hypothetical protein